MTTRPLSRAVLAVAAAACLAAGCVVAPVGPYGGEAVVAVAPPPLRVETYGAPPVVGQIWINGYWTWNGRGHVWLPGYWATPRPGYRWVPHRWEPVSGGWRMHPGHWDR